MNDKTYLVATIRPWNVETYHEIISGYDGTWHIVTEKNELTVELVNKLNPRFIFFPHWSHLVPEEILNIAECVCFHETDLPYGRGGSPIQNLIERGHKETVISAFRMTNGLDAGPIYLKNALSLNGLAEEVFIRASRTIAEMILEIITKEPMPKDQEGLATVFTRRTPEQSVIPENLKTLEEVFDHIRMLDTSEYPRAYIQYGDFRLEISRPALRMGAIEADVRITKALGEEKKS